jgi:hypothetical protein
MLRVAWTTASRRCEFPLSIVSVILSSLDTEPTPWEGEEESLLELSCQYCFSSISGLGKDFTDFLNRTPLARSVNWLAAPTFD